MPHDSVNMLLSKYILQKYGLRLDKYNSELYSVIATQIPWAPLKLALRQNSVNHHDGRSGRNIFSCVFSGGEWTLTSCRMYNTQNTDNVRQCSTHSSVYVNWSYIIDTINDTGVVRHPLRRVSESCWTSACCRSHNTQNSPLVSPRRLTHGDRFTKSFFIIKQNPYLLKELYLKRRYP